MKIIDDHGVTRFIGDVFSASVSFWTKEGKNGSPDTKVPYIRIRENSNDEEMVAEIVNLIDTTKTFVKFTKFYSGNTAGLSVAQLPAFNKFVEFVMYEIQKNAALISIERNWYFKD